MKEYLDLIRRYPSTVVSLARGGKIEAYRKILGQVLRILSETKDPEIVNCLDLSLKNGRLLLPRKVEFIVGDLWTMPHLPLYYLIRAYKPETVIETGVWTGKSSWFILQGMSDNGKGSLVSIDLGASEIASVHGIEKLPTSEIGGLVPDGLRDRWTLLIGKSSDLLSDALDKQGRLDMFFHDSDHSYENMMFEFQTTWKSIQPDGWLISDDVDKNGAWNDFVKRVNQSASVVQSRIGMCRKK